MPISVGGRIGPYEILEPLGAGGMGEVYRAHDAKLNRDVAIKVLPELFSTDPDRLARFRREAQVLASLNHTNIGHIYGLEDSSNVHALVLELVEGPTLADRIAQRPIPIDDALPIARQIADALECAHEQGIIHRDLKPANIKLRPDGTVKVLDFGLAKALDPVSTSGSDAMNSPTLTARGTQLGLIVGTAAYMSPEQARGKAVDRRADIWAFGVVLYEMLTGKRAFEGDDISITLASVLKDDLDWKALPPDLPPSVTRVLRRCLEKDPKRRLSAIGDARFDLDETSLVAERATTADLPAKAVRRWRRALPWIVAAAALSVAAGSLIVAGWRTTPVPDLVRVSSAIGAPGSLYLSDGPAFALSPDGKTLALVVTANGRRQIYMRRLANLEATSLAGTEGASAPFFSPDGQWIAFFAAGKLKKIAVTGGAAMPLCDAPAGRGGTWTADGTIIFQRLPGGNSPLHRVGDGGGTSEPIGALVEGETTQRWPQVLPGGHVLYTGNVTGGGWDSATLMVRPHGGSTAKVIRSGGYYGRYVPATGHLLYINRAVLYAVPFDLARLQTSGNAVPVIDGVLASANTGSAHIAISDTGRVVYLPGQAFGFEAPVHLVDKAGKLTVLRSQVADWYSPRFSPDGTKLALTIGAGQGADIWIHEADRDLTKLTFNSQGDLNPVWMPDGSRIAYSSATNSPVLNLFWKRANGTGEPQRLTTSPNMQFAGSFHESGKFLAFTERTSDRDNDVMILRLEGDEKSGWTPKPPTSFVATQFSEAAPSFSPDGRWIAYVSNASGRPEIHVQPFPSGDGNWKVSTDSGIHPVWSPGRSELLYLQLGPQYTVMAVPYTVEGASFRAQAPIRWTSQLLQPHAGDRPYDVHPNRDLIAFVKPPDDQATAPVNDAIFIFDFFEELRRVAPKK